MKKILLLLSVTILLFTSCEKEPLFNDPIEPPVVDTVGDITSHFVTLTTVGGVAEPRKHRGTIKVYLHTTMSDNDKKVVYDLVDKIVNEVGEEFIYFEFTDDINTFDIGMMYGESEQANDLFGSNFNTNNDWWGASLGSDNCTQIEKRYVWYNRHNSTLIKHEFLHSIGLGHATKGNSIMYHNLGYASDNMTFEDISVIKLLYYNGVYGEMVPFSVNGDNCDDLLTGNELEEMKSLVELIIDNNYQ